MKLLIHIGGKPLIRGYKQRDFLWSEEYGTYLYKGKAYSPSEFNEAYALAEKHNHDLNPQVRVVDFEKPSEEPKDESNAVEVAPVATIAAEVTLDVARATMWRLAPEEMKKRQPAKGAPELKVG